MPLKIYYTNHPKNNTVTYSDYFKAFLKITCLQVCLLILIFNLQIIFTPSGFAAHTASVTHVNASNSFPVKQLVNTINHPKSILKHSFLVDFIQWGLFPWSAIILIAVALTLYRQTMNKDITICHTTHPITGRQRSKALGTGVELFLRQSLIISAGILGTMLGLSLYNYAVYFGAFQISFFPNGYTFVIFISLFALISSRYWRQLLRYCFVRHYSTLQLFLLQTIFSVLFIIIVSEIISFFATILQADFSQKIYFSIPHMNLHYTQELFLWSFGLALVSYSSYILANFYQHKNIRIMILLSLFLPLVFGVCWLYPVSHTYIMRMFAWFAKSPLFIVLNVLTIFTIGCYFWFNKFFEELLFRSFYCGVSNNQVRTPYAALSKILRFMTMLLLFYILGGLDLLTIAVFALVATCYVIYINIGIGTIKTLWLVRHDKTLNH